MYKSTTAAALGLLLTGCVSAADVRDSEPLEIRYIKANYNDLAFCTADGWDRATSGSDLKDNPYRKQAVLTLDTPPLGVALNAMPTMTFVQDGEQTRVEWRNLGPWRNHEPGWVWDSVEHCQAEIKRMEAEGDRAGGEG